MTELDEQDESRVLQGTQLVNIMRALQRVKAATEAHQHPSDNDLELWGWAMGYNDA